MDGNFEKRIVWVLVVVLLLLVCIVSAAWWYFIRQPQIQYSPTNTVNAVLTENNSYFAQAEQLGKVSEGTATDSTERIQLYQKALTQIYDASQEGQVKYKIAAAHVQKGDYLEAIPLFKEVAANPSYTDLVRAYAVQYLANLYYLYRDAKIPDVTFSDTPYSAMLVPGDTALSYRHLYEYASTFYPLAISEARISDWYANDILKLYRASATPSEVLVQNNLSQINSHIANAMRDIARTADNPNARVDIPTAELRIAVITGKLAKVKLKTPQEAEQAFQSSQQSAQLILGRPNPYWFYYYADFLNTMYGDARAQDIQNTLSNLYAGSYTSGSPVIVFLKNERLNASGVKSSIVALGKIDPKFKTFLLTLGWGDADFK